MDFKLSPELEALGNRVRSFINDKIIPMESDPRRGSHGPDASLRADLVELARAEGLLTAQASTELGGMGLSHLEKAVVLEASGYSMLGPIAMNCAAPDEGNMHLMEVVATAEQKERWLKPMIDGHTRSCFCMTEPHPGAGSDPSLMKTTAVRKGDKFVINGTKWLITGADGAAFAIIMARTIVDGEDKGATMFLCDLPAKGFNIVRSLDTMDSSFAGGHAVVELVDLEVSATDTLGEIGQGFRNAQVRLVPARLTHCMRWLGAAQRAHDIATRYAREREAFGQTLIRHEGIGFMLADNEIDLHLTRLGVRHCAWLLDQGERASAESSMIKVHASEACFRVADRAVQILGGMGVTRETEVERIFRDIRAFRIYDGPSEVHRWSISRRLERKSA